MHIFWSFIFRTGGTPCSLWETKWCVSLHQVTAALPEVSKPLAPQPAVASSKSSPVTSTQVETIQSGIQCLKFDTRSPSQAIFKPQWLGVGFGTAGVRARGVQGRGKTSSPLSSKNTATNENNNMVVRAKQRPRGKCVASPHFVSLMADTFSSTSFFNTDILSVQEFQFISCYRIPVR